MAGDGRYLPSDIVIEGIFGDIRSDTAGGAGVMLPARKIAK